MEKYFEFQKYNTNFRTEVIAGITSFLAAMYIIIVNPDIISATGMPFSGVLTATVLVSAFSSIMMGVYARNPILLAPGMGLNAFFAFSVVIGMEVEWATALGAVFWSGVIFLLLSVFNIRTMIVKAIPKQIRYAVAAGIVLFISLIGLIKSGFIVDNPVTLVSFGGFSTSTVIFIVGLFITSIMIVKRIKGALILGILTTTILAVPVGRMFGQELLVNWNGIFEAPDFSLIFSLDLVGSLKLSIFPVIFAFLFTDMFDSLSTFIGVAEAADLTDENGEPLHIKQSLIVDSVSTTISGLFGTSSGTSYIESATGIEEGGRTGLTAIVAGVLFLPFMFLSPLLSVIPGIATATSLVLVGVFMMNPVNKINWNKFDDAIPAFLALVLIPLTYSITQGIIWGFLSWTFIKLLTNKKEEISATLIIIDIFAILALIL